MLRRDNRGLNGFPAGLLVDESFQQGMIEGVPGFVSHDVTDKGHPKQRKVTNTVEYLVADKFVFIAKPFPVSYSVPVDHHGVLQGAPPGKSILLQIIDFMQEPKGSGPADLLFKKAIG